MKKSTVLWLCFFASLASLAGVPVKWTVETSRADTQEIDLFHGETLDLEVQFKTYGQILPLPTNEIAMTYWQTNGMGTAYWRTNNVTIVSSNGIMRSNFLASMDVGTKTLRGFMGIAGNIYRASFVLHFKDAPGFEPSIVEWPYRELDFAKVTVTNDLWYRKGESDVIHEELDRRISSFEGAIDGKMDKINSAQTNAINSGITATRVSTYDGYDEVMLKRTGGIMYSGAPIRFDNDYNGIYCDGLYFPLTLFSLTGFRFYNWDTQRYSDLIPDGSYVATSNKVASLINASVGNRFVSYERTSTQTDAMQKNARENIAAVKAYYGNILEQRTTSSGSFMPGYQVTITSGRDIFTENDTVVLKYNGSTITPLNKYTSGSGTRWVIVITQYNFIEIPIVGSSATWIMSSPVDPSQYYTTSITKTSQEGYDYNTSANAAQLGNREPSYFATASSVLSKADRVSGYGLNDYLAALDSNGNLKNSLKKASSFAPSVTGGYQTNLVVSAATADRVLKSDGTTIYWGEGGGGGGTTPQVVTNIVTNVVSQAYIRQKLGVYLYVGPDNGIYVHVE